MTPKIERGIPIPKHYRPRQKGYLQKLLAPMRQGDSMFFAGTDSRNIWQAGQTAFGAGNFTVRTVDGGARIWRL